jgi:hypothetical protein
MNLNGIINKIFRKQFSDTLLTNLSKTMSHDFYFDDRLLEPLNYLTKIPGKKIRTKLIQVKKLKINN